MEAVDVAKQARQGSMAAIIHILNEQLAERGVRTRAVLIDGVLQLLCEATEEAALEQSSLVLQVREILEEIDPHHLKRVNIFSRIAQEQQMLWLAEMARNPDHSILWTEQIKLRRSPFWQRWWPAKAAAAPKVVAPPTLQTPIPELGTVEGDDPLREPDPEAAQTETPEAATPTPEKTMAGVAAAETAAAETVQAKSEPSSVLRNVLGLIVLCVISFLLGQYFEQWRSASAPSATVSDPDTNSRPTPSANPSPQPTTVVISPASAPPAGAQPQPTVAAPPAEPEVAPSPDEAPQEDAFTRAVRLAEEASLGGQQAQNAAQWQALAKKWQEASQLMQSVPDADERSAIARDRSTVYKNNSQLAQKKVRELQALPTP